MMMSDYEYDEYDDNDEEDDEDLDDEDLDDDDDDDDDIPLKSPCRSSFSRSVWRWWRRPPPAASWGLIRV